MEAMNGPMKTGSNPIKSNMNLATSANVQKQQAESRGHTLNIKLAKRIKSFSTFSQSPLKDIVTDLIDLRICDMHDNKEHVTCFYVGNKTWKCISTSSLESYITSGNIKVSDTLKGIHPRYVNIRTVQWIGQHMKCTCGKVHAFQAPCIHILAVLDDSNLLCPSMIPIRWWYVFQYYFDSEASDMAPHINDACRMKLQEHRFNQFNDSGEYLGIDMSECKFDISTCDIVNESNPKWVALKQIQSIIDTDKVLLKSNPSTTNESSIVQQPKVQSTCKWVDNESLHFGGDATSHSQLSQTCLDNEDANEMILSSFNKASTEVTHQDIMSMCETVSYSCNSSQMKADLFRVLCDFKNKRLSSSKSGFLGAEESSSRGVAHRKRRRGDS